MSNFKTQSRFKAKIFSALADPIRLEIINFLREGEKCVCEITPHVNRTQSTVSIQLSNLERLNILESRKDGKKVYYKIVDYRICEIFKVLGHAEDKVAKDTCCFSSS